MKMFTVSKNGYSEEHQIEAQSPKMAVQKQFKVKVYKFFEKSNFIIFDDKRKDIEQLYFVRK